MSGVEHFCHSPKFSGVISDVVAVPLGGGAKMLMLAGVAAERPEGAWLQADMAQTFTIHDQLTFVWNRIEELLALHGGAAKDLVKLLIFTTDARCLIDPIATFIQSKFKDLAPPVATGMAVSALASPEMLVEIDVTAVVQGQAVCGYNQQDRGNTTGENL
jgi:enamine deaminase RidA (YjgF/YER057c/UK114 family)